MKAKKFIEKKMDGDIEITKKHIVEIEVSKDIIEFVCKAYLQADDFDPEESWMKHGVLLDQIGEPEYVEIGKFLDSIDSRAKELDEELEPDDYKEMQKLQPYRDYELWVKS